MGAYNHSEIEKKWQEKWEKDEIYHAKDAAPGKENYYALFEFPYPSGNLHTGHWYAYAVPDMFARYKRMCGYNVLFPIGFDSFGLPAENAAIKNKVNPREWTYKNIETMTAQLKEMGAMFDWSRKVVASDPDYYKWTQALFLELYKKGLAYQKEAEVNWDPVDMTVLANEQVNPDGTAERSGAVVEKKLLTQWFLKITDYAERLLEDLEELDWPEEIKQSQRAWIGKSEGAEISFQVLADSFQDEIKVFTTRPDTLFGATYLVLAPEHKLIEEIKGSIQNWDEAEEYIKAAKRKSELDRQRDDKEKTGVELQGIKAINPANKEEIPIFIADYVLSGYGTGAIMAVPAHDERDFAFAKKFSLPVTQVIEPVLMQTEGTAAFREDEPVQDSNGIIAIVKHWSDEKYIGLRWPDAGWGTLLTGGIDDGHTPEETVLKEILEETGYRNAKIVRFLGVIHSKYYHAPKQVNRFGHAPTFYVELENGEQDDISEEEAAKHELCWLTKEELKKFLTATSHLQALALFEEGVYTDAGMLTNSGEFNGMDSEEAKRAITGRVRGAMKATYRIRDWLISRQRYWGCPIPVVYDPEGNAHPIPEEHLPWELPSDVDFTPTGEAPLARSQELKERTEKIFGADWTPEVDTMDTFVDSSWYFLRYTDPKNEKEFASKEKLDAWMPVNRYSGGAEHTTMHLLYSRFFHKALFDLGLVNEKEPYLERFNRGIILGTDGQKMSKRWGNVVDPDEQVRNVGADAVRMYLAFIGPYNIPGSYPWDMGGLVGVRRFLERVEDACSKISEDTNTSKNVEVELHRAIKKVGEDIESFKFNTAVSQLMIFFNTLREDSISKTDFTTVLRLLAPLAPHLSEELWYRLGHTSSIHLEPWPEYDASKLLSEAVSIVVQINGKTRGKVEAPQGAGESDVLALVRRDAKLSKWLPEGKPKKVIYVENKLINLVV